MHGWPWLCMLHNKNNKVQLKVLSWMKNDFVLSTYNYGFVPIVIERKIQHVSSFQSSDS